jgi:hypothetical protein
MNPDDSRVALFTNISSEQFTHSFGGQPFTFEAGESRMLPLYLAEHLAKHLAYQTFLKNDKSARGADPSDKTGGAGAVLWSDDEIADFQRRCITNTYAEERSKPKTEMELMQEQIERLNQDIDALRGVEPVAPVAPVEPVADVVTEPVTEPVAPLNPLPDATVYQDKAEVIAELKKRGIAHDPRKKKSDLELLLA